MGRYQVQRTWNSKWISRTSKFLTFEYDWRDNIESSWLVNNFRYEVEENYGGTYHVDFYFSGEKTYDARGSGQGATCKIIWQLFDEDGYVVDSGTCYSPSVRTGENSGMPVITFTG